MKESGVHDEAIYGEYINMYEKKDELADKEKPTQEKS